MRLFVAIKFPDEFLNDIFSFNKPLRVTFPDVSWIKRENIHLTVKFLGEIPRDMGAIKKSIEEVTKETKAFDLGIDKTGYFDSGQFIIWQGFGASNDLWQLVKSLDISLNRLGFRKEKRKYSPHLTLGRGKRLDNTVKEQIVSIVNRLNGEKLVEKRSIMVSRVILFKSMLTKGGAIYNGVARFPFGKSI